MAEISTEGRVSQLEEELTEARAEISRLRLQLHVFTSTDAVTGLANRNGLLDSIQGALDREGRMSEPFSVVLMRFPQIAGLAGEHTLDDYEEALRHLGAVIAAGLRTVDRVGRIDDTTFLAVLTNCPGEHITTVLERSLQSIRALPLSVGASEYALDPAVAALMSGDAEIGDAAALLTRAEELIERAAPGGDVVLAL